MSSNSFPNTSAIVDCKLCIGRTKALSHGWTDGRGGAVAAARSGDAWMRARLR